MGFGSVWGATAGSGFHFLGQRHAGHSASSHGCPWGALPGAEPRVSAPQLQMASPLCVRGQGRTPTEEQWGRTPLGQGLQGRGPSSLNSPPIPTAAFYVPPRCRHAAAMSYSNGEPSGNHTCHHSCRAPGNRQGPARLAGERGHTNSGPLRVWPHWAPRPPTAGATQSLPLVPPCLVSSMVQAVPGCLCSCCLQLSVVGN